MNEKDITKNYIWYQKGIAVLAAVLFALVLSFLLKGNVNAAETASIWNNPEEQFVTYFVDITSTDNPENYDKDNVGTNQHGSVTLSGLNVPVAALYNADHTQLRVVTLYDNSVRSVVALKDLGQAPDITYSVADNFIFYKYKLKKDGKLESISYDYPYNWFYNFLRLDNKVLMSTKKPGLIGRTENFSFSTNVPVFDNEEKCLNYLKTGDVSGQVIEVDWDNATFDDTLGYPQNVTVQWNSRLGSNGLYERSNNKQDFRLSWSNSNGQYMSDSYFMQIGVNFRFQEKLFGDLKDYTNLKYVSGEELQYMLGFYYDSMDTVYDTVPNCKYPGTMGQFYLRIVHVDRSTGNVTFGGWGCLQYNMQDADGYSAWNYVTISDGTALEHDGVSDFYENKYVEDKTHDTSQNIVGNGETGSIDNTASNINNAFSDENGAVDWGKVGSAFIDGIGSLTSSIGQFPSMVAKVFSFLPAEYIVMLVLGLSIVIFLRIFGR